MTLEGGLRRKYLKLRVSAHTKLVLPLEDQLFLQLQDDMFIYCSATKVSHGGAPSEKSPEKHFGGCKLTIFA